MARDMDGRPPRGPSGRACVCSGSALLGDLLGVSRSMERERDLLSVLSIYPKIFLCVFIVYRLLVGFLFVLL